jgi:hypothetical protein
MRDFRDAKAMAQTLRDELKAKGVSLTHSDNLELVAKVLGFHDDSRAKFVGRRYCSLSVSRDRQKAGAPGNQ